MLIIKTHKLGQLLAQQYITMMCPWRNTCLRLVPMQIFRMSMAQFLWSWPYIMQATIWCASLLGSAAKLPVAAGRTGERGWRPASVSINTLL